jgi:membrane-bound metal-dependent hydrolase YbcI (DUF457 family)
MPLPLGHAAIGFATHSITSHDNFYPNKWQLAIMIVILSNLPDIDVVFGLILHNNGSAFHRGPTHSILYALIMGFIASKSWKLWSRIPILPFKTCFILILSHVVADCFLTNSPVSFYWPFEVNWSIGHCGWLDVFNSVLFDAVKDTGILVVCTFIIVFAMFFKRNFYLKSKKLALSILKNN